MAAAAEIATNNVEFLCCFVVSFILIEAFSSCWLSLCHDGAYFYTNVVDFAGIN